MHNLINRQQATGNRQQATGISLITCSILPDQCKKMLNSIDSTIGVEHETIVFDNTEKQWGICKVYNYCARAAKYPILCFIHEDVIITKNNWGKLILEFIEKTPNCGVVGFAGGLEAPKNFLWWWGGEKRINVHDTYIGGNGNDFISKYKCRHFFNPYNDIFSQVLCVDGLCQIVRKEIWVRVKFDELNFTGFHFYDNDFSFAVSRNYKNYVYLQADVFHYSGGETEKKYYLSARIFQKKWKKMLPDVIGEQKISKQQEMNNGVYFFTDRKQLGLSLKDCIFHFIEINGILALVQLVYKKALKMILLVCAKPIKMIYKIIIPKQIRLIIWNKRYKL